MSFKYLIKNYLVKKSILLGQKALFQSRKSYKRYKHINQAELKIFSQNGEDGIIDYLLQSLSIKNPRFIEVGVGDYSECNTRFLYETSSPSGLIIDCLSSLKKKISKNIKIWKTDLNVVEAFVTSENILNILKENNFENNVDLFSLDIDGVDYWVVEKLPKNFSKIAVLEYNPFFGHKNYITVPNIKNFDRKKYHYSMLCFGMSLKAAIEIMSKKNFVFIGSNNMKNNAFFVRKDLAKKLSVKKINQKKLQNFVNANFRESRDSSGKLNYLKNYSILNEIKDCYVINLKKNKRQKIKTIKF